MRRLSFLIVIVAVLFAQSRCATGIEPPRTTALVEVTEGLAFTFGQKEICWNQSELEGGSDPGDCEKGTQIPFIPPRTEVQLSPFAIDQHEVSNFQYEYCVSLGACTPPSGYNAPADRQREYYDIDEFNDYPVMFVDRAQALAYCEFVGRRLPTELEWDRVARGNPDEFGGGHRAVPSDAFDSLTGCYGANVAAPFCNDNGEETVPVDEPGDDYVMEGGQKIHHLFSNVSEWTGDRYDIRRTCKDSLPAECSSVFKCSNLYDDPDWDGGQDGENPEKPEQTWEQAKANTICQQNAKSCQACDALDPIEEVCHEGCAGESRNYFTCVTWAEDAYPIASSELDTNPGGDFGVVRGGSVVTSENATCRFMSDYRGVSTQHDKNKGAPALGFRCAVDL
jgi:formylglycine-generating enzyme required for sulfatase activity